MFIIPKRRTITTAMNNNSMSNSINYSTWHWMTYHIHLLIVLGLLLTLTRSTTGTISSSRRNIHRRGEPAEEVYHKEFLMPGVTTKTNDAYMCTAIAVNSSNEWVIGFDPIASANRAHHMLLFGCSDVDPYLFKQKAWDCGHHGVCHGSTIMYAWAMNAPATILPNGVGFDLGHINYLTLQIHYLKPIPDSEKDYSGLNMTITTHQQKNKAGIYLLASGNAQIPPQTEKTIADMNCVIGHSGETSDIYLFAYRVHAHKLGAVISGYTYDPQINPKNVTQIAKGNPQWPQAFYPMDEVVKVGLNTTIHARCTWNSLSMNTTTFIGSTSNDEMCNLYLMYYTDRVKGSASGGCGQETYPEVTRLLPADSSEPLPPNPLLEEHAHGTNVNQVKEMTYANLFPQQPIELVKKGQTHKKQQAPTGMDNEFALRPKPAVYNDYYSSKNLEPEPLQHVNSHQRTNMRIPNNHLDYHGEPTPNSPKVVETQRQSKMLSQSAYHLVKDWGPNESELGQVVGVSTDANNDVVVFHRGNTVWDSNTFNRNNILNNQNQPIPQSTLLHVNGTTGATMHKWGENFFYMPHGITIDSNDNIWLTDVGLHQVFKFPPGYGNGEPLLTLGTRFVPGTDNNHFCKPTSIAVMKTGEFFVADGYCNSRIIKFSPDGKFLLSFGSPSGASIFASPATGTFNVPHSLTLAVNDEEVCTADRENGRVQCFSTINGNFLKSFDKDIWGSRLFAVSYTPVQGGKLFTVNGPGYVFSKKVAAFELDYNTGSVIATFSPNNNEGLNNPHDVTVTENGQDVYIAEIGPNKIWKFSLGTIGDEQSATTATTTQNPSIFHHFFGI